MQNVYEYTNKRGQKCYAVCHWVETAAEYQRPLDAEERRLTGCHTEFAKRLEYIGEGFTSLSAAKRRAKQLYGYAQE